MLASIFTIIIVKPIFNLLTFIYAILPGHNFGLAIIIFTIIVRLLMWPLVKKQLHQSKAMRELQPEIKRIKTEAKGDKQKESQMLMELYKEREINPFGSIGTLIIQFVILIGLYDGLRSVVTNPHNLITGSYSFIQNLTWMKHLAGNIHLFDATLLGFINLTRSALSPHGGIYWPALVIVTLSAVTQYFASKQLLPTSSNSRKLRDILKDAGDGKKADQGEVNAAVTSTTRYFIPFFIFIFTISIASALSLYWFLSGLIAFAQQSYILRKDETEMEGIADKSNGDRKQVKSDVIVPALTGKDSKTPSKNQPSKKKKVSKKKRRK